VILLAFAAIGLWMIFRVYYYADLFPNTFYLKDTVAIKQGLIYLHETLRTYHFYFLGGIMALCMVILRARKVSIRLPDRLVMLAVACILAAYVVKIGGDPRHFRYLAFPFCLAACAFAGLTETLYRTVSKGKFRIILPLAGLIFSALIFHCHPPQIERVPVKLILHGKPFFIGLKKVAVDHRIVNKITDAEYHRENIAVERMESKNRERLETYKKLKQKFRYEDTISKSWCAAIYNHHMNRRVINFYGLTDGILARASVPVEKTAHKTALIPMAADLLSIHRQSDRIGRGMYRKAVDEKTAPRWVKENLDPIEVMERKIYNRHRFFENLRLAFTFPGKIRSSSTEPLAATIKKLKALQDQP